MSGKWRITSAAVGLGAALALSAATTGAFGAANAAATPTSGASAVGADWWPEWRQPGGVSDGWTMPGSDQVVSTDQVLSKEGAAAVAEVTPSVVNIDTVVDYGAAEAAGTGIVLSADGLVLTNHHVIEGATRITGTVVGTGTTYSATVVGFDPATDVAVIDLTGARGLPVASLGDSDELAIGDLVVGVGNAGGSGGDPTAVEGEVTALDQTITATDANGTDPETLHNVIGTDADIQAGQSGGPLVDSEGDVVGVDVAASSDQSGATTSGYAIPIHDAKAVAEQIIAGEPSGTVHVGATPFLGVEIAGASGDESVLAPWSYDLRGSGMYGWAPGGWGDAVPHTAQGASGSAGVAVAGTVTGSAAEQAGLAAGDTITSLDGTSVTSADQLSALIAAGDVGDRMTVTWTDTDGGAHRATVTLGAGPVG
jgi:S1-C subfamily serine protease